MKENLLQALTELSKESSRAVEKIRESIRSFRKSIIDGLGLLATSLANINQYVLTQPLANTYLQPGNLQRRSSYNEFNPGYSFTNYQHHAPLLHHFIIVCSHKRQKFPCSEAQVKDTANGKNITFCTKMKFSFKNFFNKCDQICSFLLFPSVSVYEK